MEKVMHTVAACKNVINNTTQRLLLHFSISGYVRKLMIMMMFTKK